MKTTLYAALTALGATTNVAAHATFQDLWVDGVDFIIPSNSPVTDVTSSDFVCNAGTSPASGKCAVQAGSTVTVEMHQQPGDRSCSSEAIGGDHHGPVQVYMAAVSDAASADPTSASWFKVFADTWAPSGSGGAGDDDYWGTKDMNNCCGRMDVKVPEDIAPGDYLLRAEVAALHVAGSSGGAQFYMTCYQLTVDGSGSATPEGVKFPGAYSASDPGILVNIHAALETYEAPGPTVYSGGTTKSAGSDCGACESTCAVGTSPTSSAAGGSGDSEATPTPTTTGGGGATPTGGCKANMYEQCGGKDFTGCTSCASGTCEELNEYYSQCS
ncbi:carbohydrate-binding module family 1 protein [Poronia punctata]|nr:carbohydrate-binding module family 1 protein [Poronia punctata]